MSQEIKNKSERAVLAGLCSPILGEEQSSTEQSMDELCELLKTAGGECIGQVLQNRASPDPRTFIGEGKAYEIKEFIMENDINLVVFDNDLSPSQNRALEKLLDCHVMDRSALILDIFADRARTNEGKLQVALAQYQYLLPRLSGMWGHLVRQTASGGKGPIGTRGPGETQLETDRRHIREKISRLKQELEQVMRTRDTQRRKREKNQLPLVTIVGYTNAGKSTLLNRLTNANIPANNRLFDTLDPTTRIFSLPNGQEILISDTVGFIRKLPHTLVNAFKATLEELSYADFILHVIDSSNPEWRAQAEVTRQLIRELCPDSVPVLNVFNKVDLCENPAFLDRDDSVQISAKHGNGLDKLINILEQRLSVRNREVLFTLPYDKANLLDRLYKEAEVISVRYTDEGICAAAVCSEQVFEKYGEYASDLCERTADERANV